MENPKFLDPNPELYTDMVSSSQMNEPLLWLASHVIDSLTVDGHRLVHVDQVRSQQDGSVQVVCSTEEGTSHLIAYNPTEDGLVFHMLIDSSE